LVGLLIAKFIDGFDQKLIIDKFSMFFIVMWLPILVTILYYEVKGKFKRG
jgi:hypothetical protein